MCLVCGWVIKSEDVGFDSRSCFQRIWLARLKNATLIPVTVCSLTPGEKLNFRPLDRRSISWVLSWPVRSLTRLVRFAVALRLFSFVEFSKLFEVLELSRFLRLFSSFRNLVLCSLLVVLYGKYLWERILDAISGVKSDY